jgi:hypothetical protein
MIHLCWLLEVANAFSYYPDNDRKADVPGCLLSANYVGLHCKKY